jgi:group I intron endonuclease
VVRRVDYYVYCWTNLTNGKQYVGKGTGARAEMHKYEANRRFTTAFHAAIRKYGIDAFHLEYLATGLSEAEAFVEEAQQIVDRNSKAPNGYNLTDGGEGASGWRASPETKQRMSEAHKGLKQTPESTEKTRQGLLGKPKSEQHKKNLAEANRGKKQTKEVVERRFASLAVALANRIERRRAAIEQMPEGPEKEKEMYRFKRAEYMRAYKKRLPSDPDSL